MSLCPSRYFPICCAVALGSAACGTETPETPVSTGGTGQTGGAGQSGGSASGGVATGGTATSTGGSATGGIATSMGGKATGGAATGGTATGGAATGGKATGGAATGGTATGGAATGGKATGGTATGGNATGGGGGACGGDYTWPVYSPNIAYDYIDEYGTIAPPTGVKDDCSGVSGTYTNGWWAFRYGANKNSLVTSAAWVPMLQRFNTDFSYITDTMRWPRDGRVRAGFLSSIYLYGSGLCTDNASNTELGGWQSSVGGLPIVLASYYPVYSFDPACTYGDKVSQQGAMIHEGIHCILSSMPGVQERLLVQRGRQHLAPGHHERQA